MTEAQITFGLHPLMRTRASVALAVIGAVYIAARLWHLTSFGLFGDEVFTLWTASQDWNGLFASVVGDVAHPPLYYALLKVWVDIGGQSLWWIKLLPALISIATVFPFLFLCRELNLNLIATSLALWLMAVNGFLINHAQEPRMYSLVLLLTTSSLWLFAKLCRESSNKNQAVLCAVNLLLVFSHYFGWVIVGLEFVFLVIWRRDLLRSFFIAVSLIAVCFSPWVYFVAHAARVNPSRVNFVWNRPPPLSELAGYYGNLNGPLSYRWKVFGTAVVMLLFVTPIIAWAAHLIRTRASRVEARPLWFLSLFAFGPVALAFVASHVLPQPVWAFRYLIIAAPAYLLLVAAATERLKSRRVRIAFVVLIAGWAGVSGFVEAFNRDRVAWEPLVQRMIQAEPDTASSKPIAVYVTDPNIGNTVQFYLDKAGETRFQIAMSDNLATPGGEHWWVAFIHYNHENQPLPQDSLAEAGYRVGDVIEATAASHQAVLLPVWKK
jgi:uncharacterized membrane protein